MKYKIGELAKILNVSTNTIRRYEDKKYFKSDRNDENGYRYYSDDALFFMNNIRLLRKYGFSHEEIEEMNTFSLEEKRIANQKLMKNIDSQIEYLKNLRHRLKDDLLLMDRISTTPEVYLKDSVELHFVLYKKDNQILTEPKRQDVINNFLYESPEVQHIYRIRSAENSYHLDAGWAVKEIHREKYNITLNEYTEFYKSVPSLMGIVKIEIPEDADLDGNYIINCCSPHTEYLKTHHLKINGDIMVILISDAYENGKKYLYTLVSIPITNEAL